MAQMPQLEECPGTYLYDGMAIPDSVDAFVERAASEGTGVLSDGGAVTTDGTDLVLTYAAMSVIIRGVVYSFAGGTITVSAASTSDRRDLIVYRATSSTAGSLVCLTGTPWGVAAGKTGSWTRSNQTDLPPVKVPVAPTATLVPTSLNVSTDCPLDEIYMLSSTTALVAGNLVSKKPFLSAATLAGDTVGLLANRPTAIGSGVRYFATDDTGGTEAVDTASGVWTNTSKRGLMGSASLTASSGTLGTSPAAITGLTVSFTFGARPVKVSLSGSGKCSATGILHTVQLVNGSTPVVQQKAQQAVAANVDFPIDQFVILTGTAGTAVTINVYAGAASGTCTLDGSTTQPIVLVAEEV